MAQKTDHFDGLHTTDLTFLRKPDYLKEITERIAHAKKGDRALIITHTLNVEETPVATLMKALATAAGHGAETHLAVDARTLPFIQRVPMMHRANKSSRITLAALHSLQESGVLYAITNNTYRRIIHPFAGRSHIKVTVINNDIYVGGCNLSETVWRIDSMIRLHDKRAADWIYTQMRAVVQEQSTRLALGDIDQAFTVDDQTTLLLDVGRPKQSLIYKHALSMIDAAEQWIMLTCQYAPNSTTLKHLAAARRRGVTISIYYNHPSKHPLGFNVLHHLVLIHGRLHQPALFDKQLSKGMPYLHAKILATEKGAMIGSHNYVSAGVNFGTAELTLMRRDPAFSTYIVHEFESQLASYT